MTSTWARSCIDSFVRKDRLLQMLYRVNLQDVATVMLGVLLHNDVVMFILRKHHSILFLPEFSSKKVLRFLKIRLSSSIQQTWTPYLRCIYVQQQLYFRCK